MHILLADDHKLVADALRTYLKALRPETEVTHAADLEDALVKGARARQLDLIILDLNMPGMNGLEGLRRAHQQFPKVPVVILSGTTAGETVREALKAGAAGYISKDLSGKALLSSLELVLDGGTCIPPTVDLDGSAASEGGAGYAPDNPLAALTARERQVLDILVNGGSNKEIARKLDLKEITAAFHLKGIFRKLGVSNRTEAATTAMRLGWKGQA